MQRFVVAAVLAALVGALAPATAGRAAQPLAVNGSELSWGTCPGSPADGSRDPRQQCASVIVPLDYRNPRGRTISIEVSRISTARPGQRRGVLLFNPGGPGGPGIDFPHDLLPAIPAAVTDQFDLIGFDPRGVGYSTPVSCAIPADVPATLRIPYPAPDGSIDRNVTFGRQTAQDCARVSGDLLPYLTTANTARDMDQIRAALHEPKLSYLGYSYGTYLGAVYATLFPQRADRILLDSAVDPHLVWYQLFRSWDQAIALRYPDFTAWTAARDSTYGLGATEAAVAGTYAAMLERFDRDPVTLSSGLVIDGNFLREQTRGGLYSDALFPTLAAIWQFLAVLPSSTAVLTVPAAIATALRQLDPVGPAGTAVPADNGTAALYAVVCDDTAWPGSVDSYASNVAVGRRLFPATAGMPDNVWPCAFWPSRPIEQPVTVTDRGQRNILILQNRRDPATPWVSGFGLRQTLGRRAAFVSVDQGGHGVYLVTAATCAQDIATAFLTTGALPGRDVSCPGQAASELSSLVARPPVRIPGPLG